MYFPNFSPISKEVHEYKEISIHITGDMGKLM